jgi:hypothetical protein
MMAEEETTIAIITNDGESFDLPFWMINKLGIFKEGL